MRSFISHSCRRQCTLGCVVNQICLNRSRTAAADVAPLTYCFLLRRWGVSSSLRTPMCISFFFFTCMQPNACYPVMSYSFCLLLSRLSIHFTAPRHSNHATPECWLTPCSLWNSSRDAVSIRGDMIYLLFITLTPRWRLGAAARDVTPAVWCSWRWEQWRKCRTSTGSPGVDKQKHSDRS